MFRLLVLSSLIACSFAGILSSFKPVGHIVGGENVDIRSFPHQVSLQLGLSHFCGGSIYSATHIITAAHCLVDLKSVAGLTVVVGSTNQKRPALRIAVKSFETHVAYRDNIKDNDIALLILSQPLQFSDTVKPIRLASTLPKDGETVTVTRWGTTSEGGTVSRILQDVNLQIVGQSECRRTYRLTDNMVCAGISDGGKDSCQGDSGGPMVYNDELIGVVSFGIGCGRRNIPGVYASVPALRSWVESSGLLGKFFDESPP